MNSEAAAKETEVRKYESGKTGSKAEKWNENRVAWTVGRKRGRGETKRAAERDGEVGEVSCKTLHANRTRGNSCGMWFAMSDSHY